MVTIAAVGWGISTAGWLVSPIISKFLSKCFDYLESESTDKPKKLAVRVHELKLMLEASQPNDPEMVALAEQWKKKLMSAFCEAEDILDAIDYDILESEITAKKGLASRGSKRKFGATTTQTQDVEIKKALNIRSVSRTKLEAALIMIEELINEGHKLPFLPKSIDSCASIYKTADNTPIVLIENKQTTSAPPTKVFGREEDLKAIRKLLHETPIHDELSSSTTCYSVIGIHGLPGSGKTTLAQYISSKEKQDGHFDLFMWIHVSNNFSVYTVFAEMLEIASGKSDEFRTLDKLQDELKKSLRDKRFLLVLDDVWYDKDGNDISEQQRKLDLLLSPLEAGKMGSRILVTTRNEDAAKALNAQYLIPISDLDGQQFLSMFMHYAISGVQIIDKALEREFWSIGEIIAGKLGRSPLVARTVAGQLKVRLDRDFWIRTMRSDLLNKDTMGGLWWSYQQLQEHVKQCFTYCRIFPRRYKLQRDELVHLWMAQGFLKTTDKTKDIEDVGQDYFHMLLSTSFIQLKEDDYGTWYFTIHDLLHDLAGKAAGSDCFTIEDGMDGNIPQDVRHIFIASNNQRVFGQILNLKLLRTLIMSSGSHRMLNEDFRGLIKSLKKLRVLHVYMERSLGTICISKDIGELKHLRYLGVFCGEGYLILPRRFTQLYHLQKFATTSPVQYIIPNEITNLVNLRYMDCWNFLSCRDIGKLALLKALPIFTVSTMEGCEIQQLEHLDNLRGKLTIQGLGYVRAKEEARQAKLANKEYLTGLVLSWDGSASSYPQEDVFEALRPPFLIKSLKLKYYRRSSYPNWLTSEKDALKHLQCLIFEDCDTPPKVGQSFMYLRKLVISDCQRWLCAPENIECLTCLEELIIIKCEYLLSLGRLPTSLKKIDIEPCRRLSSLSENVESLTSLEELIILSGGDTLPRLPPSLRKLTIKYFYGSSLPNMASFPSLEVLILQGCYNIMSLPRLPRSLKELGLVRCHRSLAHTLLTAADGDPIWDNIAHIKNKWSR